MKRHIRLLFQLVFLGIILWVVIVDWNIEKYCPLGGMLTFGTKLYQGTMACNMTAGAIFMAAALALGALAIGKLFCAFICPIGTITEWLGRVGKKLKLHFILPTLLDRILRVGKYFLFFWVFYLTITRSELFCRTFDPYYTVATGFGYDTNFLWAIIAVAITVVGSILVKQFWCKYLCPLGAVTNLISNAFIIVIIFGGWLVVNLLGAELSLLWLFASLALIGFIYEIGFFQTYFTPFTKITVDHKLCTTCLKCSKKCPYGIPVHTYQKVNHPDCMLCTDCIWACDKEKAITINHNPKLSFLPAIIVVLLLAGGFWAGSKYEFKTFEIRWGEFEKLQEPGLYEQSGLKSVKCYGSSVALYRKLKDIHGIYGLDTYAGTNSVKIYYNPAEINQVEIKKVLFQPARYKVREFPHFGVDSLAIWICEVENLFDAIDNYHLLSLLSQGEGIYGFETYYGEPTRAAIFYDENQTSTEQIFKLINETKSLVINSEEGPIKLNFQVVNSKILNQKIGRNHLNQRLFQRYFVEFNQNKSVDAHQLKIYEIGISNIENMQQIRQLPYLASHLSEQNGLQGFSTTFIDRPVALIYFDPAEIDTSAIYQLINVDTLLYFKQDDSRGKLANPFQFQYPGRSYPAENFKDPVLEAQRFILE